MVLHFNQCYLVFNSFQFLYSYVSLLRVISSKQRYQYGESKDNIPEKEKLHHLLQFMVLYVIHQCGLLSFLPCFLASCDSSGKQSFELNSVFLH